MPGAVVIGAGPGIGAAVARRFAREGMPIALIGRNPGKLAEMEEATAPVLRLAADAADETALRGALDAAAAEFGVPDAVVYNAALVRPDRIGELSAREHLDAWAVNVGGALTAAARVALSSIPWSIALRIRCTSGSARHSIMVLSSSVSSPEVTNSTGLARSRDRS